MEVISDKLELQTIWNRLVIPDTIYDEYGFRMAFLDETKSELFCLVDNRGKPAALLPLEFNQKTNTLRFIGTPFLERNRGFCLPVAEDILAHLYQYACKKHHYLFEDLSQLDPITTTPRVVNNEAAYVYDFLKNNVLSIFDLYPTLSTRLVERLRVAESYIGTAVSIEKISVPEAVEVLQTIAFERFGDDSWLENRVIKKAAQGLTSIESIYPIHVVSRLLQTKTDGCVGGHIGVVHNQTYYTLFSAARYVASLPEVGTLAHLTGFKMALEANCRKLDTGLGDCGWKTRWGFEAVAQYKFVK